MTVRSDLRWRDDDDGVKRKCDVTTTCGDVRVLQSNHLVFLLFMYNYVRVLRFYLRGWCVLAPQAKEGGGGRVIIFSACVCVIVSYCRRICNCF